MGVNAFLLPVIKASLVLTVFAVGLRATPDDATYLFRHPGMLMRTVGAMNIVMPLLALWLSVTFGLDPAVKLALVTLAMSPVPPILPIRITLAGGEPAYNIGVLTATAILSVIIVPLSVWAVGKMYSLPLYMPLLTIAKLVAFSVLIPLVVGILVRRFAPGITARIARPTAVIAAGLLAVSFVPVLVRMWPTIVSLIGNGTLAAIVALVLAGLAVGHLMGGPVPEDRTVLALSTASRHPAVAIAIAAATAPEVGPVAAAVLLVLIVGAIVSLPYTLWSRRHLTAS